MKKRGSRTSSFPFSFSFTKNESEEIARQLRKQENADLVAMVSEGDWKRVGIWRELKSVSQ